MLFLCPEGSLLGKSFELARPSVPAATFDIEDHPSTGRKTVLIELARPCCFPVPEAAFLGRLDGSEVVVCLKAKSTQVRNKARSKPWNGKNRLFFVGSGRSVWHWRSAQHRSKNGLLSSPGLSFGKPWRSEVEVHLKAKSRCEIRPGASPEAAKIVFFYRFRAQRLTLKITPAQVSEVSPAAAQIVSFFSGSGRNVWHWRLPLKITAAQVKKRASWARQAMLFRCFEACVLGSLDFQKCGFAGRNGQTQLQSISKPIRGAKRAPNLETFFFWGFRRNVWHWRSPQRRSQKGVLLARQATLFRRIEASVLGKSVRSVWHRTTQT